LHDFRPRLLGPKEVSGENLSSTLHVPIAKLKPRKMTHVEATAVREE
jgi:hypothetical protein